MKVDIKPRAWGNVIEIEFENGKTFRIEASEKNKSLVVNGGMGESLCIVPHAGNQIGVLFQSEFNLNN